MKEFFEQYLVYDETSPTCLKWLPEKGTPYQKFTASAPKLNGGKVSSSFSVNKFGYEEAFRLACEWRDKRIAELNDQGAGFTERQGT